ncbi:MAG TPA: hypothetical protein VMS78_03340 [Rhizomicrobium sp.]|nr:hypothetical protein [Rhizomicrobium sp.]
MKVRFQGFVFNAGDGITLDEFANILVGNSSEKTQHLFNEHNRIFLFENKSDAEFYTGLMITIKDQKTFCELQEIGGKFKIKVSELEKGSQLMDFNFFVLHRKTFAGVYQHYHASCSAPQFGYFTKHFFWGPERTKRRDQETARLIKTGKQPAVAEKLAKKKFRKTLRFDLYYKPDDFSKILKSMSEIRSAQYEISTKAVSNDAFVPHTIPLKRIQRKIVFEQKKDIEQIADKFSKFVKDKHITKGKVFAVDNIGVDRPIDIQRNVEGFGEFEFDDVAAEIDLDLEKFSESWVIKKLLEAARANKVLFCE